MQPAPITPIPPLCRLARISESECPARSGDELGAGLASIHAIVGESAEARGVGRLARTGIRADVLNPLPRPLPVGTLVLYTAIRDEHGIKRNVIVNAY